MEVSQSGKFGVRNRWTGLVRGATIRVKSKRNKSSTLKRPLQCLYPLEIHGGDDSVHVQGRMDSNPDPVVVRPRRRALIEELI